MSVQIKVRAPNTVPFKSPSPPTIILSFFLFLHIQPTLHFFINIPSRPTLPTLTS